MVKQPQSQSRTQHSQSQQEGHKVADEVLDESLILHCWKGVEDQVNRVREFNRSQNVPNVDNYIGYVYDGIAEPSTVKQKRRWLNTTRHQKSGKWITVNSLVDSGRISDVEKDLFGDQPIPRIELLSMTRVRTRDNKEYLMRNMRAYGLSEIGVLVTLPLNDCDFTRKVPVSPTTAKLQDGTDVKVLQVGSGEFSYETSPKIYTTPWNKENVLAALEKYPPSEDNDLHGKISYTFKKDGIPNGEISISSLEEFLTDDFDGTFERIRAPAPTISIDSKNLHAYLKQDAAAKEKQHFQ